MGHIEELYTIDVFRSGSDIVQQSTYDQSYSEDENYVDSLKTGKSPNSEEDPVALESEISANKTEIEGEFEGFEGIKLELGNKNPIEKIKNLGDSELEAVVSLELWTLYKEMGPNIWPSFLRYENPPKHVKMLESRFYLNLLPEKPGNHIVFADTKEDPVISETINEQENIVSPNKYLRHINEVLRGLSEKKGYFSHNFCDEDTTRDGLITLYLVTNGIKKSTNVGRCHYCGSPKCDRRARSCRANRCFRCMLKGHQIRECDTKYGFFNQNLLLPIRIEREKVFKVGNAPDSPIKALFKKSRFEPAPDGSKFCVCLNCNQVGHINCSKEAPMFVQEYQSENAAEVLRNAFQIYPQDINSIDINNRNQYLRTSALLPSNKLFNISYLLEFSRKRPLTESRDVPFESAPKRFQPAPQIGNPMIFFTENHNSGMIFNHYANFYFQEHNFSLSNISIRNLRSSLSDFDFLDHPIFYKYPDNLQSHLLWNNPEIILFNTAIPVPHNPEVFQIAHNIKGLSSDEYDIFGG
ncbi:hypothetical protein HWI79_2296 [Cryptosporidium felis]|nr:hypothetical protein HWI79_2296 [Cryptosporidium felis]